MAMTEAEAETVAEARALFRHYRAIGASPFAAISKVVTKLVEAGWVQEATRIAQAAAEQDGYSLNTYIEDAFARSRSSANGAEAPPAARADKRDLAGVDVSSASARGLDDTEQRPVATNGHSEPKSAPAINGQLQDALASAIRVIAATANDPMADEAHYVRVVANQRSELAEVADKLGINSGSVDGILKAAMRAEPAIRDVWLDDGIENIVAKAIEMPVAAAAGGADELDDRARVVGEEQDGVTLAHFRAHMPTHSYIYTPSRELWPGASVNARISSVPLFAADGAPVLDKEGKQKTISATAWLDQHKPIEQMTWAPGMPMLICDLLISEGGWIAHKGATCFNRYRAPRIKLGDVAEAGPWLEHVARVFKDDAEHIIRWLAQRVQRPHEKINHALVLGGSQGIGKDTMLEPVKQAIGPWNFIEIGPQHLLGRFNGFLQSVILRVSEARDLGDLNRYQFYDHMKAYTAAPPDVLRIDEKHVREYSILNCTGVIITTNHKADGIFLPADDRRHFVAWSEATKEDFDENYWRRLWDWYAAEGNSHVAAYLAKLDLKAFDPKAPPPKTPAFWDIVDANRSSEDSEFADVLEAMGNPPATTLESITAAAEGVTGAPNFAAWIKDRKNRRVVPHRLENCGYVPVRNEGANDGLWKIAGRRQVVYGRSELPLRNRLDAARKL